MSEQSDQAPQSASAAEEFEQQFLHQLNAGREAIEELSDEELAAVTGGISFGGLLGHGVGRVASDVSEAESSVHSFHSAVDEPTQAAPTPRRGIPQAWKAASAGIVSGTISSGFVGAAAGKLQK